jgi:hypothetical protein
MHLHLALVFSVLVILLSPNKNQSGTLGAAGIRKIMSLTGLRRLELENAHKADLSADYALVSNLIRLTNLYFSKVEHVQHPLPARGTPLLLLLCFSFG